MAYKNSEANVPQHPDATMPASTTAEVAVQSYLTSIIIFKSIHVRLCNRQK